MSGGPADAEVEVGAMVTVGHSGCFETKDYRGPRRPSLFARIKKLQLSDTRERQAPQSGFEGSALSRASCYLLGLPYRDLVSWLEAAQWRGRGATRRVG